MKSFCLEHLLVILFFSILLLIPSWSFPAEMPADLSRFLSNQINLSTQQIAGIQNGETVVKSLPTEENEELAIFGIVRIEVPSEYFLTKFRNLQRFESSTGVMQAGLFSRPPQISDISNLKWESDDLEQIKNCDPEKCTVRLPGGSVLQFHNEVNWASSNAFEQANELMRRLAIQYMIAYQSTGDKALTSYYKDGKVLRIKDGLDQLLKNSPYVHRYVPELVSYLRNFPAEKNANAEDLFYWQKTDFGLQPVIHFNHVVIFKLQNSSHTNYAIASKILYANHYFRDGLDLRFLISDPEKGSSNGLYLIVLNRSHVDGMTGFKGTFIREPIMKKSIEKLKSLMTRSKTRMERDFRKLPTAP